MSVAYKGNKCQCCGYDRCLDALDFHHFDFTQKDFGISAKGYTRSWDKIKEELDKCVLVCANCHREIHAGLIESPVPIAGNEDLVKEAELKFEQNFN
jgi:hypothetical protein